MDNYIEDFIYYIRIERNYSNYTEVNYEADLAHFSEYLTAHKLDYRKLTYNDIDDYIKYLKNAELTSTSISRHLSALRSFYNYLVLKQIVVTNPFKLVKSPKKPLKLPNYMKYSEFEQMLSVCEDNPLGIRNRALLEVLLATGARISETVNIKVSDIDFDKEEIRVLGKGNKERICYFGNPCKEAIIAYLPVRLSLIGKKDSPYLFVNHYGDQLTTRGFRSILDKIILTSAIQTKVTPHSFRHTFATMLLNEGCDLKSVQELLGHKNLSTTSIYTHVTNDRIKDIYLHTHPRSKK